MRKLMSCYNNIDLVKQFMRQICREKEFQILQTIY